MQVKSTVIARNMVKSIILVSIFLGPFVSAWGCSATLTSTGVKYSSIQAAFNSASISDTITVDGLSGICFENVLFTNDRLRIILTGINNALISGNQTKPTIDSRSKGNAIIGITVNGGSEGIAIQRNANAIIDRVTIQGAASNGIHINEMAFAVVMNSVIQNNGLSGILVSRGSSANIGFNNFTDSGAQSNIISGNGSNGVYVASNSIAYIASNTISNNRSHGVYISQVSSARLSGNIINSNTVDGISVTGGSHVQLGDAFPAITFTDLPNMTTALNGQYGISCYSNATVEGHLGSGLQIWGALSQFGGSTLLNQFSPNCGRTPSSLLTP